MAQMTLDMTQRLSPFAQSFSCFAVASREVTAKRQGIYSCSVNVDLPRRFIAAADFDLPVENIIQAVT
jgi:hypothetical protein